MKRTYYRLAAICCSTALTLGTFSMLSVSGADTIQLSKAAGWFETAYAEWAPYPNASGYNVYADGKQADSMLIRQYGQYYRADIPGLKAGNHTVKIVPLINGKEDTSKAAEQQVTVQANDRTGFGWVKGSSSGAYNDDGTLRSNAVVLYVTEETKDKVSMDVVTDSKGTKTTYTGIQNILTAYQKGTDNRPLDIRCIGNITDPAALMDGDLLVKGSGSSKRLSCGVTVEGIGTDTVFNGFGLRIANASNVEVRNIGFMNCNSGEGDDVGLQQNNDHVWVHHCDMFYGDAGSDADQAKGDGALDTKTSTYITHSYNHFWDNGKCNLQGMKSETTDSYITYHHNWYDHSDSRHPRIRTCSVHIYNNYFDGNAKYGVGVTMGASAFVENNYFRNCPKPMMSSMQGTDAQGDGTFSGETGGIIKAYNNVMVNAKSYITYQNNNKSFDAYEASNAKEKLPSNVVTLSGGTAYNNFDTSADMYQYQPDAPEDVPAKVTAAAGRVQGGDFQWKFNNETDDASYAVNTALKQAIVNYKSSIVKIGSGAYVQPAETVTTTALGTTTARPATATTAVTGSAASSVSQGTTTAAQQPAASAYAHNFTANGLNSSFYTISGSLSTSKGTASYNGQTLTQCLKMETATSITFQAPQDGTFTMIFGEPAASAKIDSVKKTTENGNITVQLQAGTHTITKADSCNLFYMAYTPSAAGTTTVPTTTTAASAVTTTTTTAATTAADINGLNGDANCDGNVDVSDAVLLARFCAEDREAQMSTAGQKLADVNHNGTLDTNDITMILQYISRLIDKL
ncbi:MAG: dockerin type I domain-containing protein [Oscillospiraceae bacterium]|nr:dockerin type I domain-containing protein [Oscillospiraceae bacterium]